MRSCLSRDYRRLTSRVIALAMMIGIVTHATAASAQMSPRVGASVCDTVSLGTLTGDVTRMDGAPAIGARVSVLWNDVGVASDGPRVVQQAMALTASTASNG